LQVAQFQNEQIISDIVKIQYILNQVISRINKFKLINENLVPFGLKPIARSMSWIVEQIVTQNMKKDVNKYSISSVDIPQTNIDLYDCLIKTNQMKYFVNIKTSLVSACENGNYDISKAQKLLEWYESNHDLVLLLAVIKVELDRTDVIFKDVKVFNVAWIPNIYYNKANHNIQSCMNGKESIRSNQEFMDLLYRKITGENRKIIQNIMDNFI